MQLSNLKNKKTWIIAGMIIVVILLAATAVFGCKAQTAPETTMAAETKAPETTAPETTAATVEETEPAVQFETTELFIVGSDTMLEVSQALVEEFLSLYPDQNLNVPITGGGSGTGIAGLLDGTAYLANSSRPIKDEEMQAGKDAGLDIAEVIIAYDGISVVVNKDNPVEELTVEQISKLFTGEIKNWKEVGGNDAAVVIASRDSSSGTFVFFREHVVQLEGKAKENDYSKDALFLASTSAVRGECASNANAIGYIGLGYLDDSVKPIKVKADDSSAGVTPSVENVKNGTYPIARALYIYTPHPVNELTDIAQAYLDFVLSDAGQAIVAEIGFVPLN